MTTPTLAQATETLRTQGAVTVEGVFSAREMATLRALGDRTSAEAAGVETYKGRPTERLLTRGENDRVWLVWDFYAVCEEALRFTLHPAIVQVLEAIWGGDPMTYASAGHFFDKVTGGDVEIGWHQDSHFIVVPPPGSGVQRKDYWGRMGHFHVMPTQIEWTEDYHRSNIVVRINVDAQTRDNGCLRVIPRSHLGGPFELIGGLDEYIKAHEADAVECVAGEGSVTFHYPTVLHSSVKNTREGTHRRVAAHRVRRAALRIPGWDWPADWAGANAPLIAAAGFDLNPFASDAVARFENGVNDAIAAGRTHASAHA